MFDGRTGTRRLALGGRRRFFSIARGTSQWIRRSGRTPPTVLSSPAFLCQVDTRTVAVPIEERRAGGQMDGRRRTVSIKVCRYFYFFARVPRLSGARRGQRGHYEKGIYEFVRQSTITCIKSIIATTKRHRGDKLIGQLMRDWT